MRPAKQFRLPWSSRFFQVNVPKLARADETLILIVHNRPWAYLLPYFQPGVRFMGLKNNMNKPWHKNQFQLEMRRTLKQHKGPMLLLSRRFYLQDDLVTLDKYNLGIRSLNYRKVETAHEPDGVGLWKIERKPDS